MSVDTSLPNPPANRLCLDFANLPFAAGDPAESPIFWDEFVDFLAVKQIISPEKSAHIRALVETDPRAAENLLHEAERLGRALRLCFRAVLRGQNLLREWAEPINRILRVTEGHDELQWDGSAWRLTFVAREESLDWLLAAIARSGAELIASSHQNLKQCANPDCRILFYDDSRTARRRWCSMALCGSRNKVAAFARRNADLSAGKALAHHA